MRNDSFYLKFFYIIFFLAIVINIYAAEDVVNINAEDDNNKDDNVITLTGFKTPQYDSEGNLKSQVFGDFVEYSPTNSIIKITNLKVDIYKEGVITTCIKAPKCNYNEKTKMAESDSSVIIEQDNMVLSGEGFSWDSVNERLIIYNNAKVVLNNPKDIRSEFEKRGRNK